MYGYNNNDYIESDISLDDGLQFGNSEYNFANNIKYLTVYHE